MADESFGMFSVQDAKDLLALLRYARQAGFVLQAGQKSPGVPDAPRTFLAVVSTAITARSGTTAGTGKATLKAIPGVAGTATTISDYPASGSPAEVDVYNMTDSAFAVDANKPITIAREYGSGKWFIQKPPDQIYFGKSSSLILANATGTVTIWNMSGTPAATSKTVTALNIGSDQDSTSNYLGVCREDESGQWIVFFEVC